jgi:hypothetical protein
MHAMRNSLLDKLDLTSAPQARSMPAHRRREGGCELAPALASSCSLIEGYGDELGNDYSSWQIFSNHFLPETVAQPRPSPGAEDSSNFWSWAII